MGEEFLLPLVFSSGNVILLKRPDGGMADTRDLKSLGLSVRVRVPLRAPPSFPSQQNTLSFSFFALFPIKVDL